MKPLLRISPRSRGTTQLGSSSARLSRSSERPTPITRGIACGRWSTSRPPSVTSGAPTAVAAILPMGAGPLPHRESDEILRDALESLTRHKSC